MELQQTKTFILGLKQKLVALFVLMKDIFIMILTWLLKWILMIVLLSSILGIWIVELLSSHKGLRRYTWSLELMSQDFGNANLVLISGDGKGLPLLSFKTLKMTYLMMNGK